MAGLYDKQAKEYANARPGYPPQLISFIASHTPNHRLAWDAGTGSGQAAVALSHHYSNVIATDVSKQQLEFAEKRPNIRYIATPPVMSEEELESIIGPEGSVDLVTVAQAVHWFDLEAFYAQVKRALRKPGGVIAVWCYTEPVVKPSVDKVFWDWRRGSSPFWETARESIDDEYNNLTFPFEPVLEEELGTGPVRFEAKKELKVEEYLGYLKTRSAYQMAQAKGIDLLDEDTMKRFKQAWGNDDLLLTVTWAVFLRIGTV